MRQLMITSQKGGVGKTTTAINLAALAGQANQRVLLVDADPLKNIAAGLKLDAKATSEPVVDSPFAAIIYRDALPGVDVLVPQKATDELALADRFEELLARRTWAERYDLVVFDTPPLKHETSFPLLRLAKEMLVVLRAEMLSLRTLPALLQQILKEREGLRFHGILLNLPAGVQPESDEVNLFRSTLGSRLLPEVLPFDSTIEEALFQGQPVTTELPQAEASRKFQALARRLELTGPSPSSPTPKTKPVGTPIVTPPVRSLEDLNFPDDGDSPKPVPQKRTVPVQPNRPQTVDETPTPGWWFAVWVAIGLVMGVVVNLLLW